MGRNKRLDYELIEGLYLNMYSTVVIGRILDTPNGHVSKVLKVQGVKARKRGVLVTPEAFSDLASDLQENLMSDAKVFKNYKRVMGYGNDVGNEEEVKEWKDMTLEEKGESIIALLDRGLSTRKAAEEMGVSQSTLVKTKNRFLYGTDTVPKKVKVS